MLILLIRSHCKMCVLPTIQSHVFVLFATDKHARSSCRRCAHFTIGTNEQNQHFAELRQKSMFVHVHVVVLQRGLPSLNGKLERFVTKKWQKWLPNSSQTDYRWCRPLKEKEIPCQHYSTFPSINQCTSQLNPYYYHYRRELLHCPNPLGKTFMRHFQWSAFTSGRSFRIVAIPIFKAPIGPTLCLLIYTIPHKILLVFPQQGFNRLVYVFTWQL